MAKNFISYHLPYNKIVFVIRRDLFENKPCS